MTRVGYLVAALLMITSGCGNGASTDDGDGDDTDTASTGNALAGTGAAADACGHVPRADDPAVDDFAGRLADVLEAGERAQARIDTSRMDLAIALGLPPEASVEQVVVSMGHRLDAMTVDAELSFSDVILCDDVLAEAREAAAACDPDISPEASASCRGICIPSSPGPAACGTVGRLGCGNTDVDGSCDGLCSGVCELAAASCAGVCEGTCSAPCGGFQESTCGWCTGDCTGVCDSAPAPCAGVCDGTCVVAPTSPQCDEAGFRSYCDGGDPCAGECTGAARVMRTSGLCSYLSEAASIAAGHCPATRVVLRWMWRDEPGDGSAPPGAEAFRVQAAALESALGELLAAREELRVLSEYVQQLETERNRDNPLLDYFEGPCALGPLTEAREALLAQPPEIAASLEIVQTLIEGVPGLPASSG